MTLTQEQFLWLLRAGLRGFAEGRFPVSAGEQSRGPETVPDWNGIFSLSREQGVLLLVQDGLEVLLEAEPQWAQEEKALPPMTLLKWQRFRRKTARTHAQLESLMGTCVGRLQSEGLHPVVLKGEPLAALYLHPGSRSCGDIDLWVPQPEWKRAAERLSGFLVPGESNGHHRAYRSGFNEVELHWQPLEMENPFRQRAFRRFAAQELTSHIQSCSLPLSGNPVPVPSGEFNALYVLSHAFHHFIEGGVGLRQLCDWVKVLERVSFRENDLSALQGRLQKFGLMQAWQVFGYLAVHALGLPEAQLPFYRTEAGEDAGKVLALILSEGNFGRFGKGRFRRLWARASVFPVDTAFYLPRWAIQAFRRHFRRLFRRK